MKKAEYNQLRGCVGKKKFGDMATARFNAAEMERKHNPQTYNAYRCELCKLFHVGHLQPKFETPVLLAKLQAQARAIAKDEISEMRRRLKEIGDRMESETKRELAEALVMLGWTK